MLNGSDENHAKRTCVVPSPWRWHECKKPCQTAAWNNRNASSNTSSLTSSAALCGLWITSPLRSVRRKLIWYSAKIIVNLQSHVRLTGSSETNDRRIMLSMTYTIDISIYLSMTYTRRSASEVASWGGCWLAASIRSTAVYYCQFVTSSSWAAIPNETDKLQPTLSTVTDETRHGVNKMTNLRHAIDVTRATRRVCNSISLSTNCPILLLAFRDGGTM